MRLYMMPFGIFVSRLGDANMRVFLYSLILGYLFKSEHLKISKSTKYRIDILLE